jgi:hypothetical protein
MCVHALLEFSFFSGIGHVESPPFLDNIMNAVGLASSQLRSDELYIQCDGNVISHQNAPCLER